ncbi:putative reverse transcriptase domain-containing protein [Tanacetum coccineum]
MLYCKNGGVTHPGKANVVAGALSRKERLKPRRVRALAMTVQIEIRERIQVAQSEALRQKNILMENLHGLDQQMEKKEGESLYFMDRIWVSLIGDVRTIFMDEAHKTKYSVHPGADKMYYDLRDRYWWPGMKRDIATFYYQITDKVVLIKEKLKAARDRQKSYADNRRKPLEFEVGDRVMLKVSPWKGVVRFGRKGKLAPRYVGPFEILERIGPVAYRLRLPDELSGVHDTFHVSNLKKCLADASLHVPLNDIKIDKTLRFVEKPVEILDREVKSLKRSKIALVKVRWESKRGPEFTWEREDFMKTKYPELFIVREICEVFVDLKLAISMSPPIRRKYKNSIAIATGCKRFKKTKKSNCKIRIPIALWHDNYETSDEETEERPRRRDLYRFVDHPQIQQANPMNEFAPHQIPQPLGNMNGWLIESEEEAERDEVDSDLESTASSRPVWEKNNKEDHGYASYHCPWCSK